MVVKDTFAFIKFGTKMKAKQDKVREAFKALDAVLKETLKDNSEKTQATAQVQVAYILASRSIRAEQIDRNQAKEDRNRR